MNIVYDYSDVSIIIVENLFSNKEIELMLSECNYISKNIGLMTPEETDTAYYKDGKTSKRKSSSIFLDDLFSQRGRHFSNILRILDYKLSNTDVLKKYIDINPANLIIENTNYHTTLLNYYEESGHYDFHRDSNIFTFLHIIYEEPKSFSGGDIIFKILDKEIFIPIKNNMSILFPAPYNHKVTEISMNNMDDEKMMGRFSFVQFLDRLPS